MELQDVIIIGGGPAGLNAAVVLGRCRRKVLVFDDGNPRNLRSEGMHNYLSRDGIKPMDFIWLARKEAIDYGVILLYKKVLSVTKQKDNSFLVTEKAKKY